MSWRRIIASYVPPTAYASRTRPALEGLGYRIIPAATRGRFDDDSWEPDVRIVDERHIDRIPEERYLPRTPVVLLTGSRPVRCQDPRAVGSVKRPAELGELYPLLQRALEDTPRRSARTPTQLPARCTYADRRWMGAVLSLSKDGCLFRTSEAMEPGMELSLLFPLPMGRMISTRAQVIRRLGENVGMRFKSPSPVLSEAVGEYIESRLATR